MREPERKDRPNMRRCAHFRSWPFIFVCVHLLIMNISVVLPHNIFSSKDQQIRMTSSTPLPQLSMDSTVTQGEIISKCKSWHMVPIRALMNSHSQFEIAKQYGLYRYSYQWVTDAKKSMCSPGNRGFPCIEKSVVHYSILSFGVI